MSNEKILRQPENGPTGIEIHKLLDPNYFLRHPSLYKTVTLKPGEHHVFAVGDSIAMGEDDSLSIGDGKPAIGLPASSVIAYGIEKVTGYPCEFSNIAIGGDAIPQIRERLDEEKSKFRDTKNNMVVLSAGANNLGQRLMGDPKAFTALQSLQALLKSKDKKFSPKVFQVPMHFYKAISGVIDDITDLLLDLCKIHDKTESIHTIAIIGGYNFGLVDNLAVDLKTVPELHQSEVRTIVQEDPNVRKVSTLVSRLFNNAIALAIDRVEKKIPKDKLPNLLLLNTFTHLKSEDIHLHPTREGQIKIAELLLKRMYYHEENSGINTPLVLSS
jgi:hypothetical protein